MLSKPVLPGKGRHQFLLPLAFNTKEGKYTPRPPAAILSYLQVRLCTKVLVKFTARGHRHPRAGDLGLHCASFAWQTSSPCSSPYFTHHGRLSIRCKIRPGVLVHIYDVHMGGMKVRNPISSLTVCTSGLRPAWAVRDPSEKTDR